MRRKRTTKRTTQTIATPMTRGEALEAGRRAIRSCCCWVHRRYSGGASGRPQRALNHDANENMTKPGPILFTPKGGDRNGERLDQQISILPPLIRPRTRHPHEGQARPSLLWQIGNRSHDPAEQRCGGPGFFLQ
jgi:hypothetical protein